MEQLEELQANFKFMDAYQLAVIAAILLAIVEILTLTLIFLGLSIGMIGVALVQYVTDGYSINRDLLVFICTSSISILILRVIFKKKTDQDRLAEDDISQY